MSCENIPSLLDLQNTKKHVDDLGRLMGTGTGTSTNEVTGQVRPTYNAVMANLGYTRVGTFASGGTLTNGRQTLLWDIADGGDGQEYGWSGSFPPSGKVVSPGSTPLTTGGIAVGAWMSRFDPEMRIQVIEALRRSYAEAGYNLVDGSFDAGGTLVNVNDVLLHEATCEAYSWDGPLPKVVHAGSSPSSTGGVGTGAWADRSDVTLRSELTASGGAGMVGFQQGGVGAIPRTSEDKMRERVSLTDFYANGVSGPHVDPTGVLDSTLGIQAAIDYAASIGATVISPRNAKYKLSAGIIHNNLAQVDLCNSTLTFYGVSGFAWKIILGKSDRPITTPLKNVWLRGHATLADGCINPGLGGLAISAQSQRIENVLVTGCIKGFDFQENAYVVNLDGCAAWYNDLAWNSNQYGYLNMGAALSASNCLFAHNNKDVFNRLCEAQFFNCAFDRVVDRYVEDNITSAGGVHNSILLFDACRFEGGGNATINMFTNSGRMVFNDCLFLEPLTYLNLFANSGEITINGGYSRINSEFYTSANAAGATISVAGFRPISESGPGWKLSPSESGVYNGNIETGTTAGFTVTTGTPSALQATTVIPPHSGTYSLRMTGGGHNIMQSHPIKIKGDAKRFMLSVYMQNRSPQTVFPVVKFFDALGNELSSVGSLLANNTTIWAMKNFFSIIPNGAFYARFYLDLGLAVTDYVYMDDFYVNQW